MGNHGNHEIIMKSWEIMGNHGVGPHHNIDIITINVIFRVITSLIRYFLGPKTTDEIHKGLKHDIIVTGTSLFLLFENSFLSMRNLIRCPSFCNSRYPLL